MNHSTVKPTKYERERIDAMRKLGCVACAQLGVPNLNELELHHLLDGNVRMGHWYTLFLCAGHHQGRWTESQKEWVPPDLRVAISDGRKAFNRVYPAEKLLWIKVQQRLRLSEAWPPTKLVPRRECHVATGLVPALEGQEGSREDAPTDGLRVALADREGSRASAAGDEP